MRLIVEEPCEHKGAYDSNAKLVDGMTRHPLGDPIGFNLGGGKTFAVWCPGGSREEFNPNIEAAIAAWHDTGVPHDPDVDIPVAVAAALIR